MKRYIKDVYAQGYKASNRDKDTVTYLELVIEMLARGFEMELSICINPIRRVLPSLKRD